MGEIVLNSAWTSRKMKSATVMTSPPELSVYTLDSPEDISHQASSLHQISSEIEPPSPCGAIRRRWMSPNQVPVRQQLSNAVSSPGPLSQFQLLRLVEHHMHLEQCPC
jgi:hypothetical protein